MNRKAIVERLMRRLLCGDPMALFVDAIGNATINKYGSALCARNMEIMRHDLIGVYTDHVTVQQVIGDMEAAGR